MSEERPANYADLPESWALNGALAVAAGSGLVIVIRVLNVANFRVDVAMAIVDSFDGPGLLAGTTIALLPYVLPLAAVATYSIWRTREVGTPQRDVWMISFLTSLVGAVFITPTFLLLLFAVLVPAASRYRRRVNKRDAKGAQPVGARYYMLLVVGIPLAQQLLFYPTPWLAPENIQLPSRVVAGYVLNDAGRWTSLLEYQPRIVLNVPSDEVYSRTYCQRPVPGYFLSILELVATSRPPVLPACVE